MIGECSRYDKQESMLQDGCSEPHNLPLKYLRNITNNFSDERLLGEGGFGTVYKGVLQNGKTIAVKKLNSSIPGVKDKQFENEANHLMRLKHPNVVLLVGWCSETAEKIYVEHNGKYVWAEKLERLLCLEYMPKGNLRGYLSDAFSGLSWDTRYKIIEGICYGLHYLHEQWQPNSPIVHMDLKPANILLDNNMVPKIADFGLSRLFSEEKTWTCTTNRDGTLGYMSPEYINKGLISTKSDIFSLGVIIIEIVTGRRDYPDETGTSSDEFIETVLKDWTRRRVEILFGDVSPEVDYQQIRRCIQIGLDCVKIDRSKRPTISQIIKTLHGPGSADYHNIKRGIPEQMDVPAPPPRSQPANTVQAALPAQAAVTSAGPNANPLDLFPQSLPNASAMPTPVPAARQCLAPPPAAVTALDAAVTTSPVDLSHLVLAILDDRLVSRVFADAGFRSNEIKVAILRPAPPVPLLGRGLPTRARPPPLFLCSFAAADDADVPSPAPALAGAPGEDNYRRITYILARGRNPMLVGVGAASAAADFAKASPYRILSVNHQTDLLAVAAAPTTPGSGLIFSIGELNDLVPNEADLQDAARRVVGEVTRLLETHRAAGRQTVRVMGWSATYETYLAFLSKFPLIDKDWQLQLLPITTAVPVRDAGPAPGLVPPPAPPTTTTVAALSMPATTSFMESFVPFGGFMCDTYEANSLRCQQCNDRYEQEVATIIRGSAITAEAHQEGLGPSNGFDALQVRDDQMVLSTKIQNLKKKWNEYCLRLHQGCNRINRNPCQLFPHHIDVRVDRERCANPNQSSQSVALQRDVIRPSAVPSPHTNTTAKSISAPSISTQMNADLALNLQVRQSKSDEPLQDRAVPSQHSNSSNCENPEDYASPSSAAPVATDLVLATPRGSSSKDSSIALCKHVEDAVPKKFDDLNLKPSHFSVQPYTCFRSSSNRDQTSPSALHSAASGGASAFGQWHRPSPLAAQSDDLSNYKLLMERLFKAVGRQEEALSAICASIVRCGSTERRRGANKKSDIWFSFYGPDSIAKRRVGVALAELMHGSSENLIYLDLTLHDWGNPNFRGKHATDCIAEELRRKRRSVIFLDNVDKADCLVQESLIDAMETGRYKDLHGGRVADLNDSIVVLSTRMIQGCQDASLGMEEGNAFSEEKVVAARGHQLKIIVEPGTANIIGGPGGKVIVSSRHSLRNSQASFYSSSFSKRKLHISDGQEKTAESVSTSKRLHRTSSVPFDLNLPGDEADAQDGDDDSSSSHENSSSDPEGSVGNLLRSVDESINFKPFEFGKLCEDILQEFSNTMSNTLGSGCMLEIDAGAMEQVVAAAWASDSHEKRPVRTWVEQVFARTLEQLKVRCKNLSSSTLRLVTCEDETPVKEDGFGALLPSRIILDW